MTYDILNLVFGYSIIIRLWYFVNIFRFNISGLKDEITDFFRNLSVVAFGNSTKRKRLNMLNIQIKLLFPATFHSDPNFHLALEKLRQTTGFEYRVDSAIYLGLRLINLATLRSPCHP